MSQPPVDDQAMKHYLLGELSEDKKQALEESYFSDPGIFERLRALEEELIHDYVRDDLPASVRAQFEKHFLISNERRRRVTMAQEHMQAIDRELATKVAAEPTIPWWRSIQEFLRFSNPTFRYAIAGAVVLLVLVHSTRLMLESGKLHDAITQIEAERAILQHREQGLQRQLNQQQNQSTELAQQLEQERNRRQQIDLELKNLKRSSALIPFLELTPTDATRSTSEAPQRLVIQQESDSLRVRLEFKSEKDYSHLRAMLESEFGRELWRQDIYQHMHYAEGRKAIVTMLPATVLSTGDFKITLTGENEAKEFEGIEFYKFRVVKK